MTRTYETEVTVTLDDEERDVAVRASVEVAPGLGMGGAWGAEIDGRVDVRIGGEWVELEDVALDQADVERIEDALCDAALEDDR